MPLQFDPDIVVHVKTQCPPGDSVPANGVFFRHVKEFPCKEEDFESDIKTNKTPPRPKDECDSWGCSLCDSERAVEKLKKKCKNFASSGLFVKVHLVPAHGVTDSNVGHRSFWRAIGAKIAHLCEEVA